MRGGTDAISTFPNGPRLPKVHELPTHPIRPFVRDVTDARERIRPFVERARRFSGWRLVPFAPTPIEPAEPWSYSGRAAELLQGAKDVLDLGTGGGEVFESLCSSFTGRAIATEPWSVNAPVAAARLRPHGTEVVQCSSLRLPFRDSRFDVVLVRHEELDPSETARVLAPGGRLLTQQTGVDRWQELRPFFPRMKDPGDLFPRYRRGLQEAGLAIVQARSHGDLAALLRAEESLSTNGGIVLTESLFLLEGWKSASSVQARSRP